jgi:hypothetical protein
MRAGRDRPGTQNWNQLFAKGALSPVSFDEDVASWALRPVARYPRRTVSRRKYPLAGGPHISPSVPTLVTLYPDVSRARTGYDYLSTRWRRPNSDEDVGRTRRSDAQGERQRARQHDLFLPTSSSHKCHSPIPSPCIFKTGCFCIYLLLSAFP